MVETRVAVRARMLDPMYHDRERWILFWGGDRLDALLAFFRERNLDEPTERDYAFVVAAFLEWLEATAAAGGIPEGADERVTLLPRFANDLEHGTIGLGGSDPSGLWWFGRGNARTRALLAKFCAFADWLTAERGAAVPGLLVGADAAAQIRFWRSSNKAKAAKLLGYTRADPEAPQRVHFHRTGRRSSVVLDALHAFPDGVLVDLFNVGFARPGAHGPNAPYHERFDVQSQLIVMLMHYGGLAVSSVFHLWECDFELVGSRGVRVRVFHPSDGKILRHGKEMRREEYLKRIGRRPLDKQGAAQRNGWKNRLITDRKTMSSRVYFVPPGAKSTIRWLYETHIVHTRRSASGETGLDHPYLFVKRNGEPMIAEDFSDKHQRALRKLGYLPNSIDGLDLHGHRHAYGQRLKAIGLDEKVKQIAMHHANVLSQEAYQQSSEEAIARAIEAAVPTSATGLLPPPALSAPWGAAR